MSTSDPLGAAAPGPTGVTAPDPGTAFTAAIARLANELFAGQVRAPGGSTLGNALPPVPGAITTPPLPSSPPPKESDLRAVPTLLAEAFGTPSPIAVASNGDASTTTPYFLDIAGVPAAPALPSMPAAGTATAAPITNLDGLLDSPFAPTTPVVAPVSPDAPSPATPYFLDVAGVPAAPALSSVPALSSAPGTTTSGVPAAPALSSVPGTATAAPIANLDGLLGSAFGPTTPLVAPVSPEASLPEAGGPAPPETSFYFLELVDRPITAAPEPKSPRAEESARPDRSSNRGIFDAHSIKRDFPILSERVHGKPLVWLDNAATTQKPQSVIDRLSYFYEHENSNIHRAAHALAARATDAYEGARDKVRRFLNAPSSKNVVFVRGTTEAINLVAKSWGARNVAAGDEIVITWLEHHANIVPWQQLTKATGARLRVAPVNDRGELILEDFERLLGPRTKIVSVSQVSNALGTITPVREIIEMAHRHGARVLVDGAQSVSHMPVDVQALDADFFVFSGHKIFAPTGIGALYGKSDLLETMPPWQGGGNMIADVTFEETVYQPAPMRFEAGTGNIADAVGLGAALDYVTAIGLPNISRYEHDLLVYATDRLITVPGFTLIGTAREKAGVLSFVLDGTRTEDVGHALDQEGIAVRAGHHCAQPILRRFGLEATVRASLAPYNTCEDIDALVDALLRIQAGRPQRGL